MRGHKFFFLKYLGQDAAPFLRVRDKSKINLMIGDHLIDLFERMVFQADIHLRKASEVMPDDGLELIEPNAVDRRDAHGPDKILIELTQAHFRFFILAKHIFGISQKDLSAGGERHFFIISVKKLTTQLFLQRSDLLGNGRLGDIILDGGFAHRARFGRIDECLEEKEIHPVRTPTKLL